MRPTQTNSCWLAFSRKRCGRCLRSGRWSTPAAGKTRCSSPPPKRPPSRAPAIQGLNSCSHSSMNTVSALRIHGSGPGCMGGKVGDADKAHGHGTAQAQNHPGHADAAGLGDGLHRRGRHKAHQKCAAGQSSPAPRPSTRRCRQSRAPEQVKLLGRDDGVQVQPRCKSPDKASQAMIGASSKAVIISEAWMVSVQAHGQKAANQHIGDGAGRAYPQRPPRCRGCQTCFQETGPATTPEAQYKVKNTKLTSAGQTMRMRLLVLEAIGQKSGNVSALPARRCTGAGGRQPSASSGKRPGTSQWQSTTETGPET